MKSYYEVKIYSFKDYSTYTKIAYDGKFTLNQVADLIFEEFGDDVEIQISRIYCDIEVK